MAPLEYPSSEYAYGIFISKDFGLTKDQTEEIQSISNQQEK